MSKPKAPRPRKNRIPAGDLVIGQHIVGQVKVNEDDETVLKRYRRPVEVKEFHPCPGQWRTHVHVNGTDCYDGRSLVEVK